MNVPFPVKQQMSAVWGSVNGRNHFEIESSLMFAYMETCRPAPNWQQCYSQLHARFILGSRSCASEFVLQLAEDLRLHHSAYIRQSRFDSWLACKTAT